MSDDDLLREAEAFYASQPPSISDIVEALGDVQGGERLEVSPTFWLTLRRVFGAPDYDDDGRVIPGAIGLLSGIDVRIVEDLPVPWRFVSHRRYDAALEAVERMWAEPDTLPSSIKFGIEAIVHALLATVKPSKSGTLIPFEPTTSVPDEPPEAR